MQLLQWGGLISDRTDQYCVKVSKRNAIISRSVAISTTLARYALSTSRKEKVIIIHDHNRNRVLNEPKWLSGPETLNLNLYCEVHNLSF